MIASHLQSSVKLFLKVNNEILKLLTLSVWIYKLHDQKSQPADVSPLIIVSAEYLKIRSLLILYSCKPYGEKTGCVC